MFIAVKDKRDLKMQLTFFQILFYQNPLISHRPVLRVGEFIVILLNSFEFKSSTIANRKIDRKMRTITFFLGLERLLTLRSNTKLTLMETRLKPLVLWIFICRIMTSLGVSVHWQIQSKYNCLYKSLCQ